MDQGKRKFDGSDFSLAVSALSFGTYRSENKNNFTLKCNSLLGIVPVPCISDFSLIKPIIFVATVVAGRCL